MQSGGDPEIEIDRSSTWLRARCDKAGNYKTDKIKTIAEDIVRAVNHKFVITVLFLCYVYL